MECIKVLKRYPIAAILCTVLCMQAIVCMAGVGRLRPLLQKNLFKTAFVRQAYKMPKRSYTHSSALEADSFQHTSGRKGARANSFLAKSLMLSIAGGLAADYANNTQGARKKPVDDVDDHVEMAFTPPAHLSPFVPATLAKIENSILQLFYIRYLLNEYKSENVQKISAKKLKKIIELQNSIEAIDRLVSNEWSDQQGHVACLAACTNVLEKNVSNTQANNADEVYKNFMAEHKKVVKEATDILKESTWITRLGSIVFSGFATQILYPISLLLCVGISNHWSFAYMKAQNKHDSLPLVEQQGQVDHLNTIAQTVGFDKNPGHQPWTIDNYAEFRIKQDTKKNFYCGPQDMTEIAVFNMLNSMICGPLGQLSDFVHTWWKKKENYLIEKNQRYGAIGAFESSFEGTQNSFSNVINNDIIGLSAEQKKLLFSLYHQLQFPLAYKNLKTANKFFLYGAPGTGKTSAIVKTAQAAGASILLINAQDIKHMENDPGYLANKIKAFKQNLIAQNKPMSYIVLCDDADLLPGVQVRKGVGGQAGLAPLLTLLDGASCAQGNDGFHQIFVATTNAQPDQFDSALLRAGRFGKQFCWKMPALEQRAALLQHLYPVVDTKDIHVSAKHLRGKTPADILSLQDTIKAQLIPKGISTANQQEAFSLFAADLVQQSTIKK